MTLHRQPRSTCACRGDRAAQPATKKNESNTTNSNATQSNSHSNVYVHAVRIEKEEHEAQAAPNAACLVISEESVTETVQEQRLEWRASLA